MKTNYQKIQQAIYHRNAASNAITIHSGPFTCFLNPADSAPYTNYAIPAQEIKDPLHEEIRALMQVFSQYERVPRLEFIEPYAPLLEANLHAQGFRTEHKTEVLICTPESLVHPAEAADQLTFVFLDDTSPLDEYHHFVTIQKQAFSSNSAAVAQQQETEGFKKRYGKMIKTLAYLDGKPAGVGTITMPYNGTVEIAGIGTTPEQRNRGVASWITYTLSKAAFESGLSTLFLTAGDEKASRIYTRVGFLPTGVHQINITYS